MARVYGKKLKKHYRNKFMRQKIMKEFFYVLTGALAVFIFMEIIWPGIVLAYINISWVLLFWLLNVILILLNAAKENLHNC